jgi:hypothetical protein
MKRNLLAGLVFALAVPAAAFASDATKSAQAKKHPVVAQADTKSAGTNTNGKAKKAKKAKSTKAAPKNGAQKPEQMK